MLSNEERALWKAREEAARAAKRKGGKGAAPAPVEPPKKAAPAKKAAAPVEPPAPVVAVEPPAPVVAVEPPAPVEPPVELVAAPPVVGELDNPFNEQPAPVEQPAPPAAPVVAVEPPAAPPKKARAKKTAPADAAAAATVAQIAADALASAEDAPAPVRGRASRGCWLTVGEGEDRARINAARVVAVSRDRVTAGAVTAYHTINLRLYTAPVEDADGSACWDDYEIAAAVEEDAARTFDRLWSALEPHGFLRVGDAHDEYLLNPAHIQMITLERWEAVKAGKKTPAQPAEWIAQIVYSYSGEEGFTQAIPLRYLSSAARDRVVAALGELLGWSPDDPALDD